MSNDSNYQQQFNQAYWDQQGQYGMGTGRGSSSNTGNGRGGWSEDGNVPNNGLQGTDTPTMAGMQSTGMRAGSSSDDPMVNFWSGGKTPYDMRVQLGQAQQARGVNAIDPNAAGYNQQLAAQLMAQAQGRGPSLAQMQLQQGTDQNLRQQAAMAASGRSPGLASYQAMQNQGAAAQQMAGQSAQARLAEQYQAQQGLMGLTNQMQNAYGMNAQMGLQNNQFNADALNKFLLTQGQMNMNQNDLYNQLMAQQMGAYNSYLYNKDQQRTSDNDQMRNQAISGAVSGGASVAGALAGA